MSGIDTARRSWTSLAAHRAAAESTCYVRRTACSSSGFANATTAGGRTATTKSTNPNRSMMHPES